MAALNQYLQAATAAINSDSQLAQQYAYKATQLAPKNSRAHYLLGLALYKNGQFKNAIKSFTRAQKSDPTNAGIMNGMGSAYQSLGDFQNAIKCFKQSTKLNPTFDGAFNNLGVVYKQQGRLKESEKAYKKAVEINPLYGDALNNLGMLLQDMGRLDEAVISFRQAIDSRQCQSRANSNLLLTLNYSATANAKEVYEAHLNIGSQMMLEFGPENLSLKALRGKQGLKKIAYLSPDFRDHSVARFFEPLLAGHDHERYEIYCYYTHNIVDQTTEHLKQLADHWRDVSGWHHQALVDQIVSDGVDILVDLSGHTAKNRLDVFAKRAAPLQVTWLGYPNTTGLASMDIRLSDSIADPVKRSDGDYTEKLFRLPQSFLCFKGDDSIVSADEPAYSRNNYVTFGSFNTLTKVTQEVINSWAEILTQVEDSKLMLKSSHFMSVEAQDACRAKFETLGIKKHRVILCLPTESAADHLKLYDGIDIALDSFPYNGTTTSCEALWMGVPVVALAGDTHAGRVSMSLLTTIGEEDLVANTKSEYIQLAVKLAQDKQKITAYRLGLRNKMKASILCDGAAFAKNMEDAFEQSWAEMR